MVGEDALGSAIQTFKDAWTEMQKAADMADISVLFSPKAVLIFMPCMNTGTGTVITVLF